MALRGPGNQLIVRLAGLWYLSLGLAFAALAWRNMLYHEPLTGTILRCIIAVAFCVLGVTTLRAKKK